MNRLIPFAAATALSLGACHRDVDYDDDDDEGLNLPPSGGYEEPDEPAVECPNAADCEIIRTREECEDLIEEADFRDAASIGVTEFSNRLEADVDSDGAVLQNAYDTDDSIDSSEALRHFACTELFIDSDSDHADGGEWIVSGDTSVERNGNELDVMVRFDDLFSYANEISLRIGVLDAQGNARWTEMPNQNKGFSYIVDGEDVMY